MPGFSSSWVSKDESAKPLPPSVFEEFPDFHRIVSASHSSGGHIGCGTRGASGIAKWFLPDEIDRLKGKGFYLVRCHAVEVLAESENQVLFASRKPLHLLPLVNWPSLSIERAAA
jgi:hypothetical protein